MHKTLQRFRSIYYYVEVLKILVENLNNKFTAEYLRLGLTGKVNTYDFGTQSLSVC